MTDKGFDPSKYLTQLKGKDYLEVKWRLVWARAVHDRLLIDTEHIELSDQRAIFRAVATVVTEDGIPINRATGYGSETPKDFGDYIEKAETKAIGRALGALGFGTQFTDDFDEGVGNPVDAPKRAEAVRTIKAAHKATPDQIQKIHGEGKGRGLDHDDLHALAGLKGYASIAEMTCDQIQTMTTWLKSVRPAELDVYLKRAGRPTIDERLAAAK